MKVVLNVKLSGNKKKIKAMKALAELDGLYSLSVDMFDQQLTAIGNIEATQVEKKLEKICDPKIHSMDPAAKENENEALWRDDNKAKKVVLMVELSNKEKKEKAMKAVAEFDGLISMTLDRNGHKLTVIGDIDVSKVEKKLKKICGAKIERVDPLGTAKEKRIDVKDDLAALANAGTTIFGLGKKLLLGALSYTKYK